MVISGLRLARAWAMSGPQSTMEGAACPACATTDGSPRHAESAGGGPPASAGGSPRRAESAAGGPAPASADGSPCNAEGAGGPPRASGGSPRNAEGAAGGLPRAGGGSPRNAEGAGGPPRASGGSPRNAEGASASTRTRASGSLRNAEGADGPSLASVGGLACASRGGGGCGGSCALPESPSFGAEHKRQVPAEWLTAGVLLDRLAAEHVAAFLDAFPERSLVGSRDILWGSLCSGSEGAHFVLLAMEKAYNDAGVPVTFRQIFACEKSEPKRKWIDLLVNDAEPLSSSICIFKDIEDLGEAEAKCFTHKRCCAVPTVDLVVVGTSCKDLSVLTRKRKACHDLPILAKQSSKGGSAQTFRGMLRYIQEHPPAMLVFENVDGLEHGSDSDAPFCSPDGAPQVLGGGAPHLSVGGGAPLRDTASNNLDIVLSEMAARGFEGQRFMVDATEFGLPARRRRLYFLFVRTTENEALDFSRRGVTATFETLRALVARCQRSPPCVSEVLLGDRDPAVLKELVARSCAKATTEEAHLWPSQQLRAFQAAGQRWGAQHPPDRMARSPWYKTLTSREQGCLLFKLAEGGDRVMWNLSQTVHRISCSKLIVEGDQKRHVAPTLLPNQTMWIDIERSQPRVMLGREALLLQGFPLCRVAPLLDAGGFSERFLQDLAGNMVSLPVLLAILTGACAAVDWAGPSSHGSGESPPPATQDELAAALQLFDAVVRPA